MCSRVWREAREEALDVVAGLPPIPARLREGCQIIGEELHRIVLVRFVAPSVSAQLHGHDAVAPLGEVLELGREVGVVAAPAVRQ